MTNASVKDAPEAALGDHRWLVARLARLSNSAECEFDRAEVSRILEELRVRVTSRRAEGVLDVMEKIEDGPESDEARVQVTATFAGFLTRAEVDKLREIEHNFGSRGSRLILRSVETRPFEPRSMDEFHQ